MLGGGRERAVGEVMPELQDDAKGEWRPMRAGDRTAVAAIADVVHPAYPEDAAVFDERLRLYPEGCLVFAGGGDLLGYAISHPWRSGAPPRLNARLGALPPTPDTFYLHDVALLPALRGRGAATDIVARLAQRARAEKLPTMSLVAVNGSAGFWRRFGFRPVDAPALADKLRSYGADVAFMTLAL